MSTDDESGEADRRRPASVVLSGERLSKKAWLLALVAQVPADDPRTNGELARDLAPTIPLHEGTARRYIAAVRVSARRAQGVR